MSGHKLNMTARALSATTPRSQAKNQSQMVRGHRLCARGLRVRLRSMTYRYLNARVSQVPQPRDRRISPDICGLFRVSRGKTAFEHKSLLNSKKQRYGTRRFVARQVVPDSCYLRSLHEVYCRPVGFLWSFKEKM